MRSPGRSWSWPAPSRSWDAGRSPPRRTTRWSKTIRSPRPRRMTEPSPSTTAASASWASSNTARRTTPLPKWSRCAPIGLTPRSTSPSPRSIDSRRATSTKRFECSKPCSTPIDRTSGLNTAPACSSSISARPTTRCRTFRPRRTRRPTTPSPPITSASRWQTRATTRAPWHGSSGRSRPIPTCAAAYYAASRALRILRRPAEADEMLTAFQRLENNPRAHTVEFKYKKMGSLGEAAAVGEAQPAPKHDGPRRSRHRALDSFRRGHRDRRPAHNGRSDCHHDLRSRRRRPSGPLRDRLCTR